MAEYAEQSVVVPAVHAVITGERPPVSYEELAAAIAPYRERLLAHPVYPRLDGMRAIRTFMEHHCYAVMDFMCLLKSLQQRLTVVTMPW